MKKLLGLIFMLALLARGASVPIVYQAVEEEKPTVKATGEFSSLSIGGKSSFRWIPSQNSSVIGGADLCGAALDEKNQILYLAERVGGVNSPNSTRVISIDIANKKIIGGALLSERRLSKIVAIPSDEKKIIAYQEGQECFGNDSRYVLISLAEKATVEEFAPCKPGKIIGCDSKFFYVFSGKELLSYDIETPTQSPQISALSFAPACGLLFSEDKAAIFGRGEMAILQKRSNRWIPTAVNAFPKDFTPDFCVALDDDGASFALAENGGRAILISGENVTELLNRDAGKIMWFREKSLLLVNSVNRDGFIPIRLPAMRVDRILVPKKIKPANRNQMYDFFTINGEIPQFVVVDHRGNVSTVSIGEKRARKVVNLLVDKTGCY